MTTKFALPRPTLYPTAVGLFAFVAACSGNSSGLVASDGATDGRADVASKLDGLTLDGGGSTSSGGAAGRLDAGNDVRGPLPGTGGVGGTSMALDGGLSGAGGSAVGGTSGRGTGGSADGGGVARGSGGTAVAGATGTGGLGGTGGSVVRDAATALDVSLDVAADVGDGLMAVDAERIDLPPGRRDAAVVDGAECGGLDEPCCDQQTCAVPGTVCTSGAGGGTCEACGGEGQLCCAGDLCTAPGTSCVSGGGRGSGTCR